MHVCMYVVCAQICMYVRTYACMHACMYACTYVCMYSMYIKYVCKVRTIQYPRINRIIHSLHIGVYTYIYILMCACILHTVCTCLRRQQAESRLALGAAWSQLETGLGAAIAPSNAIRPPGCLWSRPPTWKQPLLRIYCSKR